MSIISAQIEVEYVKKICKDLLAKQNKVLGASA